MAVQSVVLVLYPLLSLSVPAYLEISDNLIGNQPLWTIWVTKCVAGDRKRPSCGYLGVNTTQISGELRAPCNAYPSHPSSQGNFAKDVAVEHFFSGLRFETF